MSMSFGTILPLEASFLTEIDNVISENWVYEYPFIPRIMHLYPRGLHCHLATSFQSQDSSFGNLCDGVYHLVNVPKGRSPSII